MEDIAKNINNRIFSNPIYFIFGLSWLLVHWRFFATIFLVSNESIFSTYGITKDVYLKQILFDANHPLVSILVISLPFIVTGVVLYWLQPRFLVVLFKKHKDYEVEKEKVEILAERELAVERTKKVNAEFKEIEAETRIVKAKKKVGDVDPQAVWQNEYAQFKETQHYSAFHWIVESLYEHAGYVKWYPVGSAYKIGVPQPVLAYAHSHELINLEKDKNDNQIVGLTEKGKFFVARYTQDNP